MRPQLYPAGTKSFAQRGQVISQIIRGSDSVKRVRNGTDEVTLQVAASDPLFDQIQPGMILRVQADAASPDEPYIIQKPSLDTLTGIKTVEGVHYTMMANNYNLVSSITVDGNSPAAIMASINSHLDRPSPFTFSSDITTLITGSAVVYNNINPNELILGASNSLAKITGGTVIRRGMSIILTKSTGKSVSLRRGKNVQGLTLNRSIEGLLTQIVPYYTPKSTDTDKNPPPVYGPPVKSSHINEYGEIYSLNVDYSSRADSTIDMTALASRYFSENPGVDIPAYDLQVDTVEYRSKRMQAITFADQATVHDELYGIDATVPIYETDYSFVNEINTTVKAGTQESSLFHNLESRIKETSDAVDQETDDRKDADDQISKDTDDKIEDVTNEWDKKWESVDEIKTDVRDLNRDVTNYIKSGGQGIIQFLPNRENPTSMRINSNSGGYFLLNDDGLGYFDANGAKVAIDNRGNVVASVIAASTKIESPNIIGGTITAANIVNGDFRTVDTSGNETHVSGIGVTTNNFIQAPKFVLANLSGTTWGFWDSNGLRIGSWWIHIVGERLIANGGGKDYILGGPAWT
ncbi:phage tail spike protein [Schleiferilactobacillus perolens]|uniref:Minor structural protein n=1 Tax=Schleiferilactobacillus perolens DSM 12744 TaxID=1423792 RepID=A0A0R1MY12_9LACO|nr:phage tail spike protein [Schleiferilactobacillus perolens]KRL13069.1 minor structural protein [Schleiferilactobacillus perolens DSM 12744]